MLPSSLDLALLTQQCGRVAKAGRDIILARIRALCPTVPATRRWSAKFHAEVADIVIASLGDPNWVEEKADHLLARLQPAWEGGRAARFLATFALFEALQIASGLDDRENWTKPSDLEGPLDEDEDEDEENGPGTSGGPVPDAGAGE